MRSFKFAVAALALSGLGCGILGSSDPELYRVAVSAAPSPLPQTCFRAGTPAPSPTTTDTLTSTVDEAQWVLWEGIDDVWYLDVGNNSLSAEMGHAPGINISADAIEGRKNDNGQYIFTTELTDRETDRTEVNRVTFTFEDVGSTVEGSVSFFSSCTGTGCGQGNALTCEYARRFVGRRVDADRFTGAGDINP
jgi:hypothetical protein